LLSADRSPRWHIIRRRWLILHPLCAACGQGDHLEVHHVQPFYLFPELELDEGNLLTLCSKGPGGMDCHLVIGHSGDWKAYNKDSVADASRFLEMLTKRIYERGNPG
jgi:hypothetical protein